MPANSSIKAKFLSYFFILTECRLLLALCENTPSATRYINFFETISILAGDHQMVPIGVSHISLRHKKYNQGSGRKEQRTNEGLSQLQMQEEELCNTAFPMHM